MGEPNVVLLKWLLYVFNLIVFLVGNALIVVGALFLTLFKHEFHFAQFSVQFASIVFIIVGVVLVVLAVVGLMLTKVESQLLKLAHIIGLVLTFLILAVLGIWGFYVLSNDSLKSSTKEELQKSLDGFNDTDTSNTETIEFNWLQHKFECCGLDSINDWSNKSITLLEESLSDSQIEELHSQNKTAFDVPDSCCFNATEGCGKKNPDSSTLHQDGCFEKFYSFLASDMKIISSISCILALLNLLAIGFMVYIFFTLSGDYSTLATN